MNTPNNTERVFNLLPNHETVECIDVTNVMRQDYTEKQVCAVCADSKGNTIEIAQGKNGLIVAMYTDNLTKRYSGLSLLDAIRKLQLITNHRFTVIENSLYFGESLADLKGDYTVSTYVKPMQWNGTQWAS